MNENDKESSTYYKDRRHDIDSLRVIAMFLLISYHLAWSFVSWSPYWFIPNNKNFDYLGLFMELINTWRIPILFLISGIAFRYSFANRKPKVLLIERLKVLGIPYVFGIFTFGSASLLLVTYFWNTKGESEILWFPEDGHLWFLFNILLYSFIYLLFARKLSLFSKKNRLVTNLLKNRFGMFFFALPIVLEGYLLDSLPIWYGYNFYIAYMDTLHGLILGFLWFGIGIIMVSQEKDFWIALEYNWRFNLTLGIILYINRLLNDFQDINGALVAFESYNFIFFLLGISANFLNKSSSQLDYYKQAIFPVYIVHLPIQHVLMIWLGGWGINPLLKYFLILFLICFCSLTFYHSIKNFKILRPLFGLRNPIKNK